MASAPNAEHNQDANDLLFKALTKADGTKAEVSAIGGGGAEACIWSVPMMSNPHSLAVVSAREPQTSAATLAEPQSFLSREITARQLQCLAWVEQGKSSSDIGGILGVSHKTVDKHLLKICAALGVKSRFQAAQKARQLGLFAAIEGRRVTPRSWVALPLSANVAVCPS